MCMECINKYIYIYIYQYICFVRYTQLYHIHAHYNNHQQHVNKYSYIKSTFLTYNFTQLYIHTYIHVYIYIDI